MKSYAGRNAPPKESPRVWLLIVALAAILLLLALSGCATDPLPSVIKIPITAPCLKPEEFPKAPMVATDQQLAKMDDYDLVLTLAAEREELLSAWLYAAALLKGCTTTPAT